VHINLDRTQEWLNRTQSWPRTPPVRGGAAPDPSARRQSIIGVALVLIGVLILVLIPRPENTVTTAITPKVELPVASHPQVITASFAAPPIVRQRSTSTPLLPSLSLPLAVNSYFYREESPLVRVPTDRVAPPAPVWPLCPGNGIGCQLRKAPYRHPFSVIRAPFAVANDRLFSDGSSPVSQSPAQTDSPHSLRKRPARQGRTRMDLSHPGKLPFRRSRSRKASPAMR
jgi:hypothetical protein